MCKKSFFFIIMFFFNLFFQDYSTKAESHFRHFGGAFRLAPCDVEGWLYTEYYSTEKLEDWTKIVENMADKIILEMNIGDINDGREVSFATQKFNSFKIFV